MDAFAKLTVGMLRSYGLELEGVAVPEVEAVAFAAAFSGGFGAAFFPWGGFGGSTLNSSVTCCASVRPGDFRSG
jgi:hypothetical protein